MSAQGSGRSLARGLGYGLSALLLLGPGCKKQPQPAPQDDKPAASAEPQPLSPELAAKVLAKVGDREITLGEYAATLERMDEFERLRYQTPERRRKLLDEIIQAELLAGEAKRRGLDKKPETEERIRQALRDELLRQMRQKLPSVAEIPEGEVRAYYDKHLGDFREPERRRVAHIVLTDEALAKKALQQATNATPEQWGKLVLQYSLDKPKAAGPTAPLELMGDLGIVSGPGDARGENPAVSPPVRKAVFEIPKLGAVYPELVKDGARLHIVRLAGKSDARTRSYAEAERTIRVMLLQQRLKAAEDSLERELRSRYPVSIDDDALNTVHTAADENHDGSRVTDSGH